MSSSSSSNINNNRNSWPDNSIFATIKIMILLTKKELEYPEIKVIYAQYLFFSTFGYDPSDLPISFSALLSDLNMRESVGFIERAVLMGTPNSEFINLQRKNGCVLSCYITLTCSDSVKYDVSESNTAACMHHDNSSNNCINKYGVITIRSASVIGNVKAIGMLLFEPSRLDVGVLDSAIGCDDSNNVSDDASIRKASCGSPKRKASDGSSKKEKNSKRKVAKGSTPKRRKVQK